MQENNIQNTDDFSNIPNISKLSHMEFLIPDYQRRYRWQAEEEILNLLEDLDYFFEKEKSNFYCLQPLVLKREKETDDTYLVIDGQQRLTTICLILKYLNLPTKYSVKYLNRPDSTSFLAKISNQDKGDKSYEKDIDKYHMVKAYEKISDWFSENPESIENFKLRLEIDVRFIWYEVKSDENEIEIFERLNIGKIPLNDMELVKALFLASYSGTDEDEINDRAKILYNTEEKLRNSNDKIYGLYSNSIKKYKGSVPDDISRCEIFLEGFISGKEIIKKYKVFSALFKIFRNEPKKVDDEWKKFKERSNLFLYIGDPSRSGDNRFRIRQIYHYIGYLICCDLKKLQEIWTMWEQEKGYHGLLRELKNLIVKKLKTYPSIDELYYGNKEIFNLLLLFNLETLNNDKSNDKDFEFNRFKLMDWSIEHIHSQKSGPVDDEKKEDWLKTILKYYDDSGFNEQADNIKNKLSQEKIGKKELDELINKVKLEFDNLPEMHLISNLTLLDRVSNSRFGNCTFSIKRKGIRDLMFTNKLVPHCTGKVFEKAYSEKVEDIEFWSQSDRRDYIAKIEAVMNSIIGGQNE